MVMPPPTVNRPTTQEVEVNNLDTTTTNVADTISPPPPPPPPPLMATKLGLLLLQQHQQQQHQNGGGASATAIKKRSLPNTISATDDIRKKRCSDRYDSSESSDSGVAVLSCTDSSTASSDSSDPGSPYSPGSVEEALLQQQQTTVRRPNDQHIIQSSTVSSSCKTDVPMLVRGGGIPAASTINPKLLAHPWANWGGNGAGMDILPKLVATSSGPIAGLGKTMPKTTSGVALKPLSSHQHSTKKGKTISTLTPNGPAINSSIIVNHNPVSSTGHGHNGSIMKPQTKITGFFKSQMKTPQVTGLPPAVNAVYGCGTTMTNPPPLVKKDLTNLVIRSKEFPKMNQQASKKNGTQGKKSTGERRQKAAASGAKNIAQSMQGATIKDIIMKKPVNIAPRVATMTGQPQLTSTAAPAEASKHDCSGVTVSRMATQQHPPPPQLVLTAFRLAPEMIQPSSSAPNQLRLANGAQGTTMSPQMSQNMRTADGKGNAIQFQYPLSGSFVSFSNLMAAQPTQVSGGSGILQNGQPGMMDGKQQQTGAQQQIFLSQMGGPLGKPGHNGTQFILNGTLVKLTNQGATGIELGAASNRLVTTAPVAGNGQFILNANGIITSGGGSATAGPPAIPQTMPSLQPISLSSLTADSSSNNHALNVMPKGRVVPPLVPASSPPLLLPIGKAMAAAAAANRGGVEETKKARGQAATTVKEELIRYPQTPVPIAGGVQPPLVGALKQNLTKDVVKKSRVSPYSKIVIAATAEVVRKTHTTTIETTTTETNTLRVEEGGPQMESHSVGVKKVQEETTSNTVSEPASIGLPSFSPKSLVLEKIKLKSETTTVNASTSVLSGDELRVEIGANYLDMAKIQLNIVLDQQQSHHHQLTHLQSYSSADGCAKSPILSQPKTIRFPVRGGPEMAGKKGLRKSNGFVDGNCYWEECNERFENSSKLLDHLQTHHVNGQSGPFRCSWLGCRVNGRESCSRRWLEGHVLSHGGSKTFKCIFEGCGLRFSSQLALQKHVNVHLSSSEKDTQCSNRKSVDGGATGKYLKRNGKKLRYRRQPWSARMFDFFDAGIMEGLQHRLGASSQVAVDGVLHLRGREMARRTIKDGYGAMEIYVEWSPANIVADEWISVSAGRITEHVVSVEPLLKRVPIKQLTNSEQCALQKHLRRSYISPIEETFFPFSEVKKTEGQRREEEAQHSPKNEQGSEQDEAVSDSGKGTAMSSSAASPVSCIVTKPSGKGRAKRKSMSPTASEIMTTTSATTTATSNSEDSVTERKKKPVKKYLKGEVTISNKRTVTKKDKEEAGSSGVSVSSSKSKVGKVKSGADLKQIQYLKAKKKAINIKHCPKINRLTSKYSSRVGRMGSAKRGAC